VSVCIYCDLDEDIIEEFDIPSLLAYNSGDKSFLPELEKLEKKYKPINKLPSI
jgi:hypothetical protein